MYIELLKVDEFRKIENLIVKHYNGNVKLTGANLKNNRDFAYEIYDGFYFNMYMSGIYNHVTRSIEWYLCVNEKNGYTASSEEWECLQNLYKTLKERSCLND